MVRIFNLIIMSIAAVLVFSVPANAGPVFLATLSGGAAVGGASVAGAFAATTVGNFLTSTFLGRMLGSIALSALQGALMTKPPTPGITTDSVRTGGVNPSSFILGRYATEGDEVCPPMTHGKVGKTPNAYLTYVISLGDIAGQSLSRVMIDGEYITFSGAAHADYGTPAIGRHAGFAWLKYYDGTQTAADSMLLAKYGSYPERPWQSDMIGNGVCYAIMTFRFKRDLYHAFPRCRFEMNGIALYDPRKDSTVGGSGAHRWAARSTWEPTNNPSVMAYNIMRGITLPGLGVWGGDASAADLPLASWFSGMNEADVAEALSAGGTEPRYRAGYEVTVDKEPAAVIEDILRACLGQVAEVGGQWKLRVGGMGLPVMFITDDDIIVTKSQDYEPFPASDQRFNGIDAKFPDPESGWEPKSAPPRYNSTWEAEDGNKRRVASLDLPACPYPNQVQRVMKGYIADDRRFRRHNLTLPPDAAILEPLDTISWSSARNGYTSKLFDVTELQDDIRTLLQGVALREVDASDVSWSTGLELPYFAASTVPEATAVQTVEAFDLLAHTITDGGALDRRPALRLVWDGAEQDGVTAIEYEVRVSATAAVIKRGAITDVTAGALVLAEGILPATAYEGRARPLTAGPVAWTSWEAATTAAVQLGQIDLDGSKLQAIVLGPINVPGSSVTVIATLSIGSVPFGTIWKRGIVMEARRHGSTTYDLRLERRFKYGGVWSAWSAQSTFEVTDSAWDLFAASATFVGAYDDFEYRLVSDTTAAASSGGSGAHTDAVQNIYITAVNIVK